MLKFVFDTNVFVSALISKRGNPALLLDRVGKSYTLFISKDILGELKDVISRDKFGSYIRTNIQNLSLYFSLI